MEETETTETAAAETEAAESPAETEAAEAAPAETEAAEAAPAETETAEAAPAEEVPVTFDTFAWDDWDGQHGVLPEDVQGWAEKINGYWNPKLAEKEQDAARYQRLYEALSFGEEDPRVQELTAANKEWETKYSGLESKFKDFQGAIEDYENQQVEEYVNRFYSEFGKELESNEELKNSVTELVKNDFDPYYAIKVAKLGSEAAAYAGALKEDKVPDNRALELISLKFGGSNELSAQKPVQSLSKSQQAVAGATPAHRPQKPVIRMKDLSRREQLQRAAKLAIASQRK